MTQYDASISNIKNFLDGNLEEVILHLKEKMMQYAQKLEFEKASELKEDVSSIESLKQNQIVRDII